MIAIFSTGVLFYQIGSQLIAKAPRQESWSAWRFGAAGLVAIASIAVLPQVSQFYEDGSAAPSLSMSTVVTTFGGLAIVALLYGYGFIRLLVLLFHGREAAYADRHDQQRKPLDYIEQQFGPEAEAYRMRRLAKFEKHISSDQKNHE